jgi:hypothetical protein
VPRLHIVQGGVDNGDKKWLERAAKQNLTAQSWTVPKSVAVGDDVVIYVRGYGFFASGRIESMPKPRRGWYNRYGARVEAIKLIEPAISLGALRRYIPRLDWARYPRSITTPPTELADEIKQLIRKRRTTGKPDLDPEALESANIDELRRVALLSQRNVVKPKERKILYRARSTAIRLYVLRRANGRCEGCNSAAPFRTADHKPYLEAHHVERLADDGPDHPKKVIGLCPNCHRRAHHSHDKVMFKRSLLKRLAIRERR